MRKFFVFVLFCCSFSVFCQGTISYNGSGNYELVERTDLRRYDNGRYKGLVSREVSAFIIPSDYDNGYLYDGTFWVLENTRRNGFDVGFGVDDGIPAKFRIGADGHMDVIVDNGFPSYRSFPTFPSGEISVGDSWEAQAVRAVDPLYKGVVTRMPVMVRYTYSGDSVFNGEDVFVIDAQWATRYGMGTGSYYVDFGGDRELKRASGSHKARIFVSKASGNSVLIRDDVDETFMYADGNQIQFKGSVSLFTKYPPAVDRMKFLPALKRVAGLSDEDVEALRNPVERWNEKDFGDGAGENGIRWGDGSEENGGVYGKGDEVAGGLNDSGEGKREAVVGGLNGDVYGKGDEVAGGLNGSGEGDGDGENGIRWGDGSEENGGRYGKGDEVAGGLNGSGEGKREAVVGGLNGGGTVAGQGSGYDKEYFKDIENKESSDKDINIKVDNTPAGVRLTMENLQFLPDSAQLIPGQLKKLDEIAEVLKSVPGGMFLIEGHTASIGYEEGEMKLSIERAESIAREFSARGINRAYIICKGSGGTKPVADNKTAEGKAKNRRVEITILD